MARPRPVSKKQIKEIEDAIFPEVEKFLLLKAALDAVSTGNPMMDLAKPEVRDAARAWNAFVYTRKAHNYIEVVYS